MYSSRTMDLPARCSTIKTLGPLILSRSPTIADTNEEPLGPSRTMRLGAVTDFIVKVYSPAGSVAPCQRTSVGSVKLPWNAFWATAGTAFVQTAANATAETTNIRQRSDFMGSSCLNLTSVAASERFSLGTHAMHKCMCMATQGSGHEQNSGVPWKSLGSKEIR